MDTTNYFESVVAPALQQKCQELFNYSLMLETNLRVESAKNKTLQARVEDLETRSSDVGDLHQKLKLAETREASLANTLRNVEQQANANLQVKIKEFDAQRIALEARYAELQKTYSQLGEDYMALKKELEALRNPPAAKPHEPKIVKTLKGKVTKIEHVAPPLVMSEPDDF